MGRIGALRDRWLWPVVCILAAGAAYLSGLTFWTVWTARSEVPWRDQWFFLDDARQIEAHVWGKLWYPYWGHRPVTARVVTLLDVRWFSGLNTPIIIFILAMQAVHAALLVWIAWQLFSRFSRPVFVILAAVIVQLSFTSLQLENFLWAAQAGYILVWTGATAAFFLLATYAGAARMRGVLLGSCLIAGTVSMLSSPNGVCVWPVLVLQAWVLRLSIRVRALLILTGVWMIGFYLWRYTSGPGMGMGPVRALLHPWQSLPIVGMLMAATLTSGSIRGATVVGCMALVLALYILVKAIRYRPPAVLTVYAALAVFALLTFASMVASRISPEFVESHMRLHQLVIPSRYYTTLSFFWIAMIGLSIWTAMKNRREWPQLVGAGLMTAIATLGTVSWQIDEAANWRGFYRELDVGGSGLIMHVSDRANPFLEQIYPETPLRLDVSGWLEKNRLALFAERRASLPGQRVGAADVESGRCRGDVQAVAAVSGGAFRIAGWAIDTRTGRPPRDLVFVDGSATIVGVARSGLRRPDMKGKIDAVSLDTIGWQGYATAQGERVIAVYGLLDGSGHYCAVGQPISLPVK